MVISFQGFGYPLIKKPYISRFQGTLLILVGVMDVVFLDSYHCIPHTKSLLGGINECGEGVFAQYISYIANVKVLIYKVLYIHIYVHLYRCP